MDLARLHQTASALVADGKGLLAADESTGSIRMRFEAVGLESTETSRRDYRHMLVGTPDIGEHISGVILFDETIRQAAPDGTPLVRLIEDAGMIPGIKVDSGAKPLAPDPDGGETVTEGLDDLRDRFREYADMGARFAKWRAVYTIGVARPSARAIQANAHTLARYAALAQENGLVPIVEPEVLMDGDHDIAACFSATEAVQHAVFEALRIQGVRPEGMLLKPNMVISGKDAAEQADPDTVAKHTLACFRRTVPAAVPGIVFLSGGQGDEQATVNLDAINRRALTDGAPWPLSFSYGRALQQAALRIWAGDTDATGPARAAFMDRAEANHRATLARLAA